MRSRRPPWRTAALFALQLGAPYAVTAFYLPGVAPTSYTPGAIVPLNVNHLTPVGSMVDGQLHSMISFDYYHSAFHFCQPEGGPQYIPESLGSILLGDRIMTSPFELKMGVNETCKQLCEPTIFDEASSSFVNQRIRQGFALNWLVDGLPAGQVISDQITNTQFHSQGFTLGSVEEDQALLNNHYDIIIDFHVVARDQLRVVGVIVQPSSRQKQEPDKSGSSCGYGGAPLALKESGETNMIWTYSTYWRPSPTAWATRWDSYLHVFDPKIHWFSLINSAIIVVFLVVTVLSILMRALRRDIQRYNRLDNINLDDLNGTSVMDDGVQEDSGWKLVHGDVFRSPTNPLLLSVFLGNGTQLFVMTGLTICFALLGFLSPSNRGSLGTIMIILYTLLGAVGGYVSARSYKTFSGEKWKANIILTPVLVPVLVFSVFLFLNFCLWLKSSSGAVPFTTLLVLVAIWFLISVPLSFAGSWMGFRAEIIQAPVRTNQIPRQIPPSTTTYMRPLPSMAITGILPFGAIFVELYFVMSSIWFSKVYYMFGFLFLCYGLMIITCAAVTVLMVYFLLCSENYHWQWRAFMTAGASAGYVFANAMVYWVTKLQLSTMTGMLLYVGYSAVISFLFFILTGSIGFFASWLFVQKIYASIKID